MGRGIITMKNARETLASYSSVRMTTAPTAVQRWMVMGMADTNTVTIPLEEYFDLRQKADMNAFLMNELGRMDARFQDFERRLWDLERERKT